MMTRLSLRDRIAVALIILALVILLTPARAQGYQDTMNAYRDSSHELRIANARVDDANIAVLASMSAMGLCAVGPVCVAAVFSTGYSMSVRNTRAMEASYAGEKHARAARKAHIEHPAVRIFAPNRKR